MGTLLARLVLGLTGWKLEGDLPKDQACVLIAAPHTSNWDLFYMLALAKVARVRVRWMGKHTLFRAPFGAIMRWMGGIPIYRHSRNNIVQQMTTRLTSGDPLVLAVPAEGTRGWTAHWKSGFYHIANAAQVPIAMGYLDYSRKRGGFGPVLMPTGNIGQDMDAIRAFYADKVGKFPECAGRVRLLEEA